MATSKRRRSALVNTYFAPDEIELVQQCAREAGTGVSTWVRSAALERARRVRAARRAQLRLGQPSDVELDSMLEQSAAARRQR